MNKMVKRAFGESLVEWDQSLRNAIGPRNHGDFPRSVKLRTHNQTGMENVLPVQASCSPLQHKEHMFYISIPDFSDFVKSSTKYKGRAHERVRLLWRFAPEGFAGRFFLDIERDDLPEQSIIDPLPPFYAEQLLAMIVAGVCDIPGKPQNTFSLRRSG